MNKVSLIQKEYKMETSPDGPVAKTLCSPVQGIGFDLGQGTRFHMPKLRVCMLKDL